MSGVVTRLHYLPPTGYVDLTMHLSQHGLNLTVKFAIFTAYRLTRIDLCHPIYICYGVDPHLTLTLTPTLHVLTLHMQINDHAVKFIDERTLT